jgi:RNA polymerase sigma-70 factor, ECF subfamily
MPLAQCTRDMLSVSEAADEGRTEADAPARRPGRKGAAMLASSARTPTDVVRLRDAAFHAGGRPSATGGVVDEPALLAALRAGDERAFESMIRLYGGRLLAVARRFTGNDEDARDVLQSAYLAAFRSVGQFEGSCQLSTWLHRIVVNTALMRLRSRRRKPEESIEALLPGFHDDGHHIEQFAAWTATADVLLERKQTRTTVRACIQQLPDTHRTVLLLRDIEERSTQEVAEMLGLTTTAVKVRLHRARQALSTLLRKQFAR